MNPLDSKPMKNITSEYLDKIKSELNCVGVFLIITDSQMPCPDVMSGVVCEHGHEVASGITGMSAGVAMQLASESISYH